VARARGISRAQRRTLDRLSRCAGLPATYLAGGVAVAVHLGHRRSRDLELFTYVDAVSIEPFRALTAEADVELVAATEVAVHLRLGATPVDVVRYRYPLLEPTLPGPGGWPTASLLDLATMKLAAISRRGLRRDFWDLAEIVASGIPLVRAGEAFRARFGKSEADLYHIARSLTFFDDAERDPVLPEGMTPRRWARIRADFESLAATLLPR